MNEENILIPVFVTAKLTFGDHICESAPSVSAFVNLSYDSLIVYLVLVVDDIFAEFISIHHDSS
jgi:hypothetical protein